MSQVKKSKEDLTAPKIFHHMADVEDLRTSSLPADPSVGGTSPLPCSSICELPVSLLFPKAGHSAAAGQPSKQTSNFCKTCLDISHINHECCSPLWIQQLPIGINRKPFYPLRSKKSEGVTTVNGVSGFWACSMSHKQIGLLFFLIEEDSNAGLLLLSWFSDLALPFSAVQEMQQQKLHPLCM